LRATPTSSTSTLSRPTACWPPPSSRRKSGAMTRFRWTTALSTPAAIRCCAPPTPHGARSTPVSTAAPTTTPTTTTLSPLPTTAGWMITPSTWPSRPPTAWRAGLSGPGSTACGTPPRWQSSQQSRKRRSASGSSCSTSLPPSGKRSRTTPTPRAWKFSATSRSTSLPTRWMHGWAASCSSWTRREALPAWPVPAGLLLRRRPALGQPAV
jgi:4-alpha-glucanotransferase